MHRSVAPTSACLSLIALLAAPLAADAKDLSTHGVLLDKVVAVVNEGVVMQSELDLQTREIEARLQTQHVALPPEDVLRGQVLDRLVQEEIQQQRADRAGI
jgi:peptidyl-prolyl cis-trans isomerase SurA